MQISLKELLDYLQEQHHVLGNVEKYIRRACPVDQADEDSICFCKKVGEKALEIIKNSRAGVIVCSDSLQFVEGENEGKTLIQVANPRLTFSRILTKYFYHRPEPVIHTSAIIDEKARLGRNIFIGPHSYIGDCEIGDGTIIEGQVYIHPWTRIGKGVVIHTGTVIGAESVAFERNEKGEMEWFPQISGVVIEDNVEVGANATICRGSLSETLIGEGTKLDTQVIISHGSRIGKHCIVAAGAIICGSVKIGDRTWVGPSACIRESLKIGSGVVVGAGSVVHRDIADNLIVTGSPARQVPAAWVKKAY